MQRDLRFTKIEIIPNGIDLSIFKPLDKDLCKKKLGWSKEIYHILFAANPLRHEKNFTLSEKAIKSIKSILPLELHFLQDLDQTEVPIYINASDMILLSSHWEGSPNVIKEAMACNCPAVSTDVGDVRWLFGDEPGYFITGFEPEEVTDKIKSALKFAKEKGKTKGRNRIIQLGLASEEIAKRIISIYSQVIRETRGK
jgi:glycosyltransferase involved in cell wall biosynthesis